MLPKPTNSRRLPKYKAPDPLLFSAPSLPKHAMRIFGSAYMYQHYISYLHLNFTPNYSHHSLVDVDIEYLTGFLFIIITNIL